jgi:nitrile hydratase accessory protein
MSVVLDAYGVAAPPRRNGELVFAEPWESRAFGLALTLHAGGAFEWEEFRQSLIARIAEAETAPDFSFYRCWAAALEQVLVSHGLLSVDDVTERAAEVAARPAGWDHGHAHHH